MPISHDDDSARRFEYATDTDPSLNYCLWNYAPPAPAADKFRAINLLYHSFDVAQMHPAAFDLVEATRDGLGPFRTVFGIKLIDGRLAWEFYFYDYARRSREVSVTRFQGAVSHLIDSKVTVNESLPYFMFSVDIDDRLVRRERSLDEIHMYLGNPGSAVSSGIAYTVCETATRLDNFYFFFDAQRQIGDVYRKVASSPFLDETTCPIENVVIAELRQCRTICIANKGSHDCIYFSGINIHQLEWFLAAFGYPPQIRAFVMQNRHKLDHLLYDVGFDYRQEAGTLRVLKSGYYGVF